MRLARLWSLSFAALLIACSDEAPGLDSVSSFRVTVTEVNGSPLPADDKPLPANLGDVLDTWGFQVEARDPNGNLTPFDGLVRLSVRPGAVMSVEGEGAVGRRLARWPWK